MMQKNQSICHILYSQNSSYEIQQLLKTRMGKNKGNIQCQICYKMVSRKNIKPQSIQPKDVCYGCWYKYLKMTITDPYYKIGQDVPSPTMSQPLNLPSCLYSLHQKDKEYLEEMIFKKYASMTKDIGQCPSATCNFAYIDSKCWRAKKCPKCSTRLVVENSNIISSALSKIYLRLINRCPNCQLPIQKISGCPHMTCVCGHEFCWYCFKDFYYYKSVVYNQHSENECTFTVLSKFVIVLISLIGIVFNISPYYNMQFLFSYLPTILLFILKIVISNALITLNASMNHEIRLYHRHKSFKQTYGLLALANLVVLFLLWLFSIWKFVLIVIGIEGGIGLTVFLGSVACSFVKRKWNGY